MTYKRHYLSEKGSLKYCPLQHGIDCNSYCAWFDHEEQECKIFTILWGIRQEFRNYKREDKDDRQFKF